MARSTKTDSEYGGGGDGMFGNVDAGGPLTPYLELLAYRRSAVPAGVDERGVAVPTSPLYGTGGVRAR